MRRRPRICFACAPSRRWHDGGSSRPSLRSSWETSGPEGRGLAGSSEGGIVSNRSETAAIPLCPLIGRETEFHTLVRLWESSRLVTLYGQSGAGKSALARAAAAALADQKPNRVLCLDAGGARGGAAVLRLLARV